MREIIVQIQVTIESFVCLKKEQLATVQIEQFYRKNHFLAKIESVPHYKELQLRERIFNILGVPQ